MMKVNRQAVTASLMTAGLMILAPLVGGTDLKKIEKLGGECAAGKNKSCQQLAKIATDWSEAKEIRLAAIENLSDRFSLRQVAIALSVPELCQAAVNRLTDERDLAAFARAANGSETMAIAAAVVGAKVENHVLLEDLAKNAKLSEVQAAAVLKITDSALLREIALESTAATLPRVAALANPNLSDQELFTALANSEKNTDVRAAAILRLTDPTQLSEIVESTDNSQIRSAALQNSFLDRDVRMKMAKSEKTWVDRMAALVTLDDLGLFEFASDAGYSDPPKPDDPNLFQSASYDISGEKPRPPRPGGRPIRIGGSPLRIEDDGGGLVFFAYGKNMQISCRGIEVAGLQELAAFLIRDPNLLEKLALSVQNSAVREAAKMRMLQLK